jgi:cleavage stimulation factor subunit 3
MTAREVLKELRLKLAPLGLSPPSTQASRPTFVLPLKPTYTTAERTLCSAWRCYLKWEEGNPLGIEDSSELMRRLQGVCRKALIEMRYYVEIW